MRLQFNTSTRHIMRYIVRVFKGLGDSLTDVRLHETDCCYSLHWCFEVSLIFLSRAGRLVWWLPQNPAGAVWRRVTETSEQHPAPSIFCTPRVMSFFLLSCILPFPLPWPSHFTDWPQCLVLLFVLLYQLNLRPVTFYTRLCFCYWSRVKD